MYKLRSIASLQPNPRRLSQQKYYHKNTAKVSATNSRRYRKQKTAGEIPDGLASLAPILPPVTLPQAKWEAQKGAKKKAIADATLRAKKTLPKPRILLVTPYRKVKVGNESQRIMRSGSEPRDRRTRNNVGRDNPYCDVKYSIS